MIKTKTTGPLYCFANDLWLTYGNNSGSVILTVKQLPDREIETVKRKSDARSAIIPWLLNLPASIVLLAIPCVILAVVFRVLWNSSGWLGNIMANQLIWLRDAVAAFWSSL